MSARRNFCRGGTPKKAPIRTKKDPHKDKKASHLEKKVAKRPIHKENGPPYSPKKLGDFLGRGGECLLLPPPLLEIISNNIGFDTS